MMITLFSAIGGAMAWHGLRSNAFLDYAIGVLGLLLVLSCLAWPTGLAPVGTAVTVTTHE